MTAHAQPAVLSARTSGAVLVAAAGRARRGRVREALEALDRVDARALGLILTMVPGRTSTAYGYGLQAAPQKTRSMPIRPSNSELRGIEGGRQA